MVRIEYRVVRQQLGEEPIRSVHASLPEARSALQAAHATGQYIGVSVVRRNRNGQLVYMDHVERKPSVEAIERFNARRRA